MSQKPLYVRLNDRGQLHAVNAPAIEYPDGWKIYRWHGVRIPIDWQTVQPDPKWLLTTENAEQRRALLQVCGYGKVMAALGATTISESNDMRLSKIKATVDVEDIVLLTVKCPSTGDTYTLRVPPDSTDCERARRWTLFDEQSKLELLIET